MTRYPLTRGNIFLSGDKGVEGCGLVLGTWGLGILITLASEIHLLFHFSHM